MEKDRAAAQGAPRSKVKGLRKFGIKKKKKKKKRENPTKKTKKKTNEKKGSSSMKEQAGRFHRRTAKILRSCASEAGAWAFLGEIGTSLEGWDAFQGFRGILR